MIDPNAVVPLYQQLKEILRERIVSGEWKPGSKIPSESQLCAAHGISRITVREATDDLVTEGWLYRHRGKGTFVRSSKPEIGLSPLFMLQQLPAFQGPPEHALLSAKVLMPPQTVRVSLSLEEGEEAFEIVRVRIISGKATAFEVGYLPRSIMYRLPTKRELKSEYYYEILRRCTGVVPVRTRVVMEAMLLGRKEAKVLKAPVGSPALRLERVTTSASRQPVLLTRNIVAGDNSRYVVELDVPPPMKSVAGGRRGSLAGQNREGPIPWLDSKPRKARRTGT